MVKFCHVYMYRSNVIILLLTTSLLEYLLEFFLSPLRNCLMVIHHGLNIS